jgi:hypothetical protein
MDKIDENPQKEEEEVLFQFKGGPPAVLPSDSENLMM